VLGWNLSKGEIEPANLPALLDVDFISGCAMLIHRDVYREIGLFDPHFFAYWEEVDFCSRARRKGFRLAVATRAKMWHKVSKTANRESEKMRYLYMRNMIFYTRKNARGGEWILMAPYLCFRFTKDLVKDLVQGRWRFRIYRLAWKDGWGIKITSSSSISKG
jgi:GT2 family glycosyltransferase